MPDATESRETFDHWCIVELFGHKRLAGRVSEATIGGCHFLRLDVPAVDRLPESTHFYANGAIYGLHPVSEEVARAVAARCQTAPVSRWDVAHLLPSPAEDFEE